MYKLEDIKDIHLELTSKCQARCPMCPRRIHGGMKNPLFDLNEITLEQFKDWFSEDFIRQLNALAMCGNLGDPIIAQDCLEIFQYLRELNTTMRLTLNTNASARQSDFWKGLAQANVKILFGIDGLADTHEIYRIDTDWHKIIENAKTFIAAGGYAEWHMLVFKHNEHQVEECRALSTELGFKVFTSKHTSRFTENGWTVLDDEGRTRYTIYPTQRSLDMIPKKIESVIDIKPNTISCMAKRSQQIYIGADGAVSPCCWLDLKWGMPMWPKRIDYMDRIGEFPNLNQNTLKEIFDSKIFDRVEDTWEDKPLLTCSQQCGKFDKLRAQYVD
jgi:MoaA/NifB/PqqE/SkfB family radical SAM enzyme